MKVKNIYDKDSHLTCLGKDIFKTTEAYLRKFPKEYSECYYHNLETLELIRVNRLPEASMKGAYDQDVNKILFIKNVSLGHELFHMASTDLETGRNAIESKLALELGLIEGMTEYSFMKAYGLEYPNYYPFEVFSVSMLEDIPNLFKPYFIPNYDEFIKLFPKRQDIYSLIYSLYEYNDNVQDFLDATYGDDDKSVDIGLIIASMKDTMNSLISIELSMENDQTKLDQYGDKFMDILSSIRYKAELGNMYHNYLKYANKLVNKRIRKR